MADEFQDIIAVSEGKNHCFLNLYKESYDDCIVWCNINLYGVPSDISEEKESAIYDGNFEQAVIIGKLSGYLILCNRILEMGENPYDVCDDISGDLEAVISVLQEDGGPLNEGNGNEYQDVFYIEELILEEKYNSQKLNVSILNSIPDIVFSLYHVYPNILCYYPRPLPYEEDINKKIKRDIAVIAARDIMDRQVDDNTVNSSDYQLMLDDEQTNYILGRHNSGDSYPETAKDKSLWSIYQKAGFIEVNNSRFLYKSE